MVAHTSTFSRKGMVLNQAGFAAQIETHVPIELTKHGLSLDCFIGWSEANFERTVTSNLEHRLVPCTVIRLVGFALLPAN